VRCRPTWWCSDVPSDRRRLTRRRFFLVSRLFGLDRREFADRARRAVDRRATFARCRARRSPRVEDRPGPARFSAGVTGRNSAEGRAIGPEPIRSGRSFGRTARFASAAAVSRSMTPRRRSMRARCRLSGRGRAPAGRAVRIPLPVPPDPCTSSVRDTAAHGTAGARWSGDGGDRSAQPFRSSRPMCGASAEALPARRRDLGIVRWGSRFGRPRAWCGSSSSPGARRAAERWGRREPRHPRSAGPLLPTMLRSGSVRGGRRGTCRDHFGRLPSARRATRKGPLRRGRGPGWERHRFSIAERRRGEDRGFDPPPPDRVRNCGKGIDVTPARSQRRRSSRLTKLRSLIIRSRMTGP
jgi:hypothetical protein